MATENPFVFGKAAEATFFTDREEDAKRLRSNLTHGINTILISPRRWGKTSLVKKVVADIGQNDFLPIFIDIFQCKSERDFCFNFATNVIKQSASKIEEWVEMAKTFLSSITPKFSFGPDPMTDFSISFEWEKKEDTIANILQLPEQIAQKKGVPVILCIDEFRQIGNFSDPLTFQKQLRSVWQHQQNVTYCLFGSKKHLMEFIFNEKSMPLFKFGDMLFLKKISTDQWIRFICNKFQRTGKSISPELAERICLLTDNLSSYVQQLSWIVWYKSDKIATNLDVNSALNDILEQNKVFFQREVEQLTELQYNFLRALANGVTTGFSRKEVIQKYKLESSANIQAIKKSLLARDIIQVEGMTISFTDALFKIWIQRQRTI